MQFERKVLDPAFLTEMWPLLERHYKEIAVDQDIPLKPDFDRYLGMEQTGFVRCFTARDPDGSLVGYAVFFVHPNLHYSTSLWAVQDVLFLERTLRGLGCGKDFIAWCDQQLKTEGVQKVVHHVKDFADFSPLLIKLGYKRLETIWGRRLDVG